MTIVKNDSIAREVMFALKPHRRYDPLDYIFVMWKAYMQYSIEFEDPKAVPAAVEELIRCVNAFRVQGGLIWLNEKKQDTTVHKIPAGLNTLEEVNDWMYRTHTPNFRKAFGTIAADDHRIVVNASHICGDGVFIAKLLEHLSKPSEYGKTHVAPIPLSAHEYFESEIMKRKDLPIVCAEDPLISRIIGKLPQEKKNPEFKFQYIKEPIQNFTCYNPSKQKCERMSESLWTSIGLANAAHRGTLDGFGQSTVVDLRRVTPHKDLVSGMQNWIASVPVHGKPTMEMTLEELGNQMRHDFQRRITNKDYLGHMKAVWNAIYRPWKSNPIPGLGLEMSSVGQINIRNPIRNVHMTLQSPPHLNLQSVSCLSYTVNHLDNKTQNFLAEMQYTTHELHPDEARVIGESVRYAMKNFGGKMTVGAALSELEEFQKLIMN